MTAPDEFGNQVHRPWPVQRNQGRNVLDGVDLELAAQIPHPAGFQLEYPERVRLVQQIVSLCVVQRQVVYGHRSAVCLLHQVARIADDRQRLEPQKIHLEQAEGANRFHRILGDDGAVFVLLERQQINQRLIPDDHACRVNRRIAREVFEDKGRVN